MPPSSKGLRRLAPPYENDAGLDKVLEENNLLTPVKKESPYSVPLNIPENKIRLVTRRRLAIPVSVRGKPTKKEAGLRRRLPLLLEGEQVVKRPYSPAPLTKGIMCGVDNSKLYG